MENKLELPLCFPVICIVNWDVMKTGTYVEAQWHEINQYLILHITSEKTYEFWVNVLMFIVSENIIDSQNILHYILCYNIIFFRIFVAKSKWKCIIIKNMSH